jgi:ABC-2 type transport system permease protein
LTKPATYAVSPTKVFLALLSRDARVTRRELPFFLIRTTMQPLMFIVVFGFLLPKMGFLGAQYKATLLPGILGISLTMSAIQSVALPMMQDFGWTNEIEDRLLAPIPIPLIAIEKILVGTIQGVIAGLFVLPLARLIMGPIPGLTLTHIGETVGIALLGSATFSAIGLFMGTAIKPQQIGFMFSLIIAPMIFFGCAYYPWRGLDVVPAMKYAVLINPLVYVAEGLRGVLTPNGPHMPLPVVVAALSGILLIVGWLGVNSFLRRALK